MDRNGGGFSCGIEVHASGASINMPIKNVPLLRNEAGFANQVLQHFLIRVVVRAGGGNDVLFDHDRAHVVRPKTEGNLT